MPTNTDFTFEGASGQYSLRNVLTVFFKRWRLIVAASGIALTASLAFSILRAPVYESRATLLVSKARAEVPLAPTESSQAIIGSVDERELNSEVEVLRSRKLIEEVLEVLGSEDSNVRAAEAAPNPVHRLRTALRSMLGRRPISSEEMMVVRLSRALKIDRIPGSTAIRISFRSTNPEWATSVVRTLTDRYIEGRVQRYQSPQIVSFFEEQMLEAEQRLIESETALEGFSESADVAMTRGPDDTGSLSEQKELVLKRLSRSQIELEDAETKIDEISKKIESLKARLLEEPERLETSNRDNRDVVTELIEQRLASLELERDALLQDFRPDSRYVQDIEKQIDLARERLATIDSEVGMIDGTEINPIHQNLKEELLRSESELDGIRARRNSLAAQVAVSQRELEDLNQKSFQLEVLRRQAIASKESYELYRKKHEEARISAAMDQQRLINVTIAQPAQTPLTPVGRGFKTTLLLGFLVGLMAGVGLAVAAEFYLDHSFTTGDEIERVLGISHIASIPEEA
jgi:uncharacterized protein involved in exopolysaccharide biosynthesis